VTYTKNDFGFDLQKQLLEGNDFNKIAKWAFKIYLDRGLELEKDLDYVVLKSIAMEEGAEFRLSNEDLLKLADELICKNN
jgi:hypothetical protein